MARGKYELWMTENALARLRGWARDGLTDAQIADAMGVSRSTLAEWKKKYEPVAAALAQGKDAADRVIENALFERAKGYTVQVKKHYKLRTVRYDEKTGRKCEEKEELAEVLEDEHVPADVRAQIFWLSNRKRAEWSQNGAQRETADGEVAGVVELPAVMETPAPAGPEGENEDGEAAGEE